MANQSGSRQFDGRALPTLPDEGESGASSDSLRVFVGAFGGAVAEISDANVRDLSQLCDEFKFIELAKTIGDWQAERPLTGPGVRRKPEERLES
jgi:hypothetical protein